MGKVEFFALEIRHFELLTKKWVSPKRKYGAFFLVILHRFLYHSAKFQPYSIFF